MEGSADADKPEGGVEERAASLAGGQTVINQQPLHDLLAVSPAELAELARLPFQHHELPRPLLQPAMRCSPLSRHTVALT